MKQGKGSTSAGCCDGGSKPYWICASIDTPAGNVDKVSTVWSLSDSTGAVKCRLSNKFRMTYRVAPGLYAVGSPDAGSPVMVTANYKLSFDILRRSLDGMDCWILVLDTKGINVWCAAGKGTFGTKELVERIRTVGLDRIVTRRNLILPQLGAPGIHAHVIKKESGFTVRFGPVRADDIKEYIKADFKASSRMRQVTFTFADRLALVPMEFFPVLGKFWVFALVMLIVSGMGKSGIMYRQALLLGWPWLVSGLGAIVCGSVIAPLLLPVIPSRSFAAKGWLLCAVLLSLGTPALKQAFNGDLFLTGAAYLFFPVVSSFLTLNFTGTTSFTNMSGVKKELRFALPLYAILTAVAIVLVVVSKLVEWGII